MESEWGFDTSTYDEPFYLIIENLFYVKYGEWKTDIILWWAYGYEKHAYVPVSKYCCTDPEQLRHIYFTQVQGTVPYNRELGQYEPVKDNWFAYFYKLGEIWILN